MSEKVEQSSCEIFHWEYFSILNVLVIVVFQIKTNNFYFVIIFKSISFSSKLIKVNKETVTLKKKCFQKFHCKCVIKRQIIML